MLFFTPEYNRSVSGCLKNAIDVASPLEGKSAWNGLAAAVVSSLQARRIRCKSRPSAKLFVSQYSDNAAIRSLHRSRQRVINSDGRLANADTTAFLETFMSAFGEWVKKNQRR